MNSIFVEREHINCILMQQDLNYTVPITHGLRIYIWCISHMLVYKWLCAALITAVMYAIDIEHCQIWLPMTRWMHNWMQCDGSFRREIDDGRRCNENKRATRSVKSGSAGVEARFITKAKKKHEKILFTNGVFNRRVSWKPGAGAKRIVMEFEM